MATFIASVWARLLSRFARFVYFNVLRARRTSRDGGTMSQHFAARQRSGNNGFFF